MHDDQDIKTAVRERYAGHATAGTSCCGIGAGATARPKAATTEATGCGCGAVAIPDRPFSSEAIGYAPDDLAAVPEGADLGLGCGNPLALLGLREGETVRVRAVKPA